MASELPRQSTSASNTGAARGWSVWLNTAQGIQLGGAYCWQAWAGGETRRGATHSKALAEELARAALGTLIDDERRRRLRSV